MLLPVLTFNMYLYTAVQIYALSWTLCQWVYLMFHILQSDMEYLEYHLTTVRDVELLTGVRFFRNMYTLDSLKHRTYQPLRIWPLPASAQVTHKQRIGKAENSHLVWTLWCHILRLQEKRNLQNDGSFCELSFSNFWCRLVLRL